MSADASNASQQERGRPRPERRPEGPLRPILLKVIKLFRPYTGLLALLFVLIVVTAVLELLPALLIKEMIDETDPAAGDRDRITFYFLVLVGLVLGAAALGAVREYVNQIIGQGIMYGIRRSLYEHLQGLSVRFFTQNRAGEILSRIATDITAMQGALTGALATGLQRLTTLLVAFSLMLILDWRLAMLAPVAILLLAYPVQRLGQYQRRLRREWHAESADMASHLEETLSVSGTMLVKGFGRQGHEAARFDESNARLRAHSLRLELGWRFFALGGFVVTSLAPAVVFWIGAQAVVGEELTIGTVVAFALLMQRLFGPFAQLAQIYANALASLAMFERVFEYLDIPLEVDERPGAVALERPRGEIRFEGVTFGYTDEHEPALDGIDLVVEPGQMAALVGPSGAGKTTVTYLMQRFYDPNEGRVTLDGHDLRDLKLESLSAAVGSVMQDAHLFHVSLADNIRYGRLNASDEEVEAAASLAGLDSLTERLPRGLDTTVGERGYSLSGGEKQRVSIARAILKDPPVLILDEATASLDSRLEREIREATTELARGRTTIVIAHRLSTVLAADVIFVLDHGRIVEQGRHEELLALGGLYAELYEEQFGAEALGSESAATPRAERLGTVPAARATERG